MSSDELATRLRTVLDLKKHLVWDIIDMIRSGELVAVPDDCNNYQNIDVWQPIRVSAWKHGNSYQATIGTRYEESRLSQDPDGDPDDGEAIVIHNAHDWYREQAVCEALWRAMWEQAGRNEATYARHIDYVEQLPEANDAVAVMRAAHDKAMAETKGVDT